MDYQNYESTSTILPKLEQKTSTVTTKDDKDDKDNKYHELLHGIMIKVGNYEIRNLCYQSYPCQHRVKNTETEECGLWSGPSIYKLLKDHSTSHPHFNRYKLHSMAKRVTSFIKHTNSDNDCITMGGKCSESKFKETCKKFSENFERQQKREEKEEREKLKRIKYRSPVEIAKKRAGPPI